LLCFVFARVREVAVTVLILGTSCVGSRYGAAAQLFKSRQARLLPDARFMGEAVGSCLDPIVPLIDSPHLALAARIDVVDASRGESSRRLIVFLETVIRVREPVILVFFRDSLNFSEQDERFLRQAVTFAFSFGSRGGSFTPESPSKRQTNSPSRSK